MLLDPGALVAATDGAVALPGDPGWDGARGAWNLAADRRPVAVATPRSVAEVASVLDVARRAGVCVVPETTGHGADPADRLDTAILLRMDRLGGVEVDVARRRARAGGGARWFEVCAAAAAHGLAPVATADAGVGVAGSILGGGVGWLARAFGLAAASALAVELITPAGRLIRAHAGHEAELFWALRGGGRAPGVVTAVELALQPVPALCAGALSWPAARRVEVLRGWLEWTSAAVPDELTAIVRLDAGRVTVTAVLLGGAACGAEVMEPLRELGPETDDFAALLPGALSGLGGGTAPPAAWRRRHLLLDELAPSAAELVSTATGDIPAGVDVELRHLGGALAAAPWAGAGAGALASLPGELALVVSGPPAACDAAFAPLAAALGPWAAGGACPSLGLAPGGPDAAYPPRARERLRRVRAQLDPQGLIC